MIINEACFNDRSDFTIKFPRAQFSTLDMKKMYICFMATLQKVPRMAGFDVLASREFVLRFFPRRSRWFVRYGRLFGADTPEVR